MYVRDPGELRLVYQTESSFAADGVDIVVIPAVWSHHKPGRPGSGCSWAKSLAAFPTGKTRVFLFEYHINIDGSSLWEQLLGQSYPLVKALDESRPEEDDQVRPLLLICHSLGGLIAKKALTIGCRSQHLYADVLAGIVFLGTPHLVTSDAEGWSNLKLLMKANSKDISKNNLTDHEMEQLISVCRQFESLQLHKPILSVFEQRKTRFNDHRFTTFRRKNNLSEVLVEETMVQFNGPLESLYGVDKTHLDLCNVDEGDAFYDQLSQYLSNIGQYAMQNALRNLGKNQVQEFVNMTLRPKHSMSSFAESCSHAHAATIPQTPEAESDELGSQIDASSQLDHDDSAEETSSGHMQLELPFTHLASMSRNPRFFGREDVLEAIDKAFGLNAPSAPDSGEQPDTSVPNVPTPPSVFILCGMAGIGKTEIATEYVYLRMSQFDATIWIYADTLEKLSTQFLTIAKELRPGTDMENMDVAEAREIVKAWLSTLTGHRLPNGDLSNSKAAWLIVFDNADNPEILYDWLPEQGPGCILVTSKYPCVKEATYRFEKGYEVEPFSPSLGSSMLKKLSGRDQEKDSSEASERIAKTLGGLPFAISQMSGIIRQKHLTLKEFEEWYDEDSKHLHGLKTTTGMSNYQHTVATAWTVEQLTAPALALLQVLSLLDPDRIPEEMLVDGAKDVKFQSYPTKKRAFIEARAELLHISLTTKNMATNELKVHRLVQAVVRQKMSESATLSAFSAVSILISAVWPWVSGTDPTRNQPWRVPIAERLEAHICNMEKLFGEDIRAGEFEGTVTSGSVFSSYAWYTFERGHSHQTQVFGHLAQEVLEKALVTKPDEDKYITHWLGEAAHNLSLAGVMTGSSDGIQDVNRWLTILHDRIEKHDLPSDRISLATAYNQMGICLLNKGKTKEAAKSFQESLDAYRSAPNRPNFSGTFPALSLSLIHCMEGRAKEAEEVVKPMIEEHIEILGSHDTSSAESGHLCRRMGTIREVQLRFQEALEYHQDALDNMRVTLGEKHYFTGDCFYSIAMNLLRLGDVGRARENLDLAINVFTSTQHTEAQAARAMWKKACLLRDLGHIVEGKALFQKATELRRSVVPYDKKALENFEDEDWNESIVYWSR